LGIGTSSPTRQLDVSKAGTAYIRASDTSSSVNMEMLAASSGGWVGTQSNHSLNFQTNNTERMRIDSSGNVGIGAASSGDRLEVKGVNNIAKFYSDSTASQLRIQAPTVDVIGLYTGTNDALTFGTNNAERLRIDSSGNTISGNPKGSSRLHMGKN